MPQKLFGEVTSPLYPKPYPNNFEATTVISVPAGHRVKLVFWHFDVEPSEGCFYDYVKVGGSRGLPEAEALVLPQSWLALDTTQLMAEHGVLSGSRGPP